jgi:hypothetical protein
VTAVAQVKPQVIEDEQHERIYERVAAVDVAKDSGMVCTRMPHPSRPGARQSTVWTVKARMAAIGALGRQLKRDGIQMVTLESTGLLADLAAPRGALLYSRLSRGEFGGYSRVRWLTQDPKGEGDNSMPGNQWPRQCVWAAHWGTRAIWLKLDCLNPNLQKG